MAFHSDDKRMRMHRPVLRAASLITTTRCIRHLSKVTLLSATDAAALAPSTALQLQVRVPTDDDADEKKSVRLLDIFVCRDADGAITAFENYCPHAGGALNMVPDRFFTRDGEALLCSRHGAKFKPEDGLCFHGPCAGDALNELDIDVVGGGAVETMTKSLMDMCRYGGAFTLCHADSPQARGPQVQRPPPPPPPRPRRARRRTKEQLQPGAE